MNGVDITAKSGVNIMIIEHRKTKDLQAETPTGGTALFHYDKSRCHQRQYLAVNWKMPNFQWEKRKSTILIYGKELIQA